MQDDRNITRQTAFVISSVSWTDKLDKPVTWDQIISAISPYKGNLQDPQVKVQSRTPYNYDKVEIIIRKWWKKSQV